MDNQQRIKALKDDINALEEEKNRIELIHLESKVQLSNKLRELMEQFDRLKKADPSHLSQPALSGSQSITTETQAISNELESLDKGIPTLEKQVQSLTEDMDTVKHDSTAISTTIEELMQKRAVTQSQEGIIDQLKTELREKQGKNKGIKTAIKELEKKVEALEEKNTELELKVESAKRVSNIVNLVASFKEGSYSKLAVHEEQARTHWVDALDLWFAATNHFTSRDPLFFPRAYKAFHNAVEAFHLLFKGQLPAEEDEEKPALEDMIEFLYRENFPVPSYLLEKINKISDKIDMGQEVLPLPAFWDKVFDFMRKNMKLLQIVDPSVRDL